MDATFGFGRLHGKNVLVRSTQDRRHPPAGRRGTIEVGSDAGGGTGVRVVVEFPDMVSEPAHLRIIPLDEPLLKQLLASEANGTFELEIPDKLD
jgi:hypothetical protein